VTAHEFAKLVKRAKRRVDGTWWDAQCPAHDDRRASLSFADGNVSLVVECHAGCTRERVAHAVGRTVDDFKRNTTTRERSVATYTYTDERSAALYEVVRLEPKDFRCRRADGTWSMAGVRRVPYRLHELAEAARVYITEGEKDADALVALGLIATCNEGGAGKWREEHTRALVAAAVPEAVVLRDNDVAGASHQRGVATSCAAAGLRVKCLDLPGLPAKGDVSDHIAAQRAAGRTDDEIRAALIALADEAPAFSPETTAASAAPTTEPELRREGFDLVLTFPAGVRFDLRAIRDGREGVRGELTVTHDGRRLSWGALPLSSTSARETLRKKLEAVAPGLPWSESLDDAAFRLTQAAREGEPLVTLTGIVTSPTRELLPRLLYEGEPTLIYGDGDTGKSLVALTLAVAVHADVALPFGLKPTRAVTAAYLDWETNRDTIEARLAPIAAGLGIDPPAIVYKRMTRPLVDEAPQLAAEFARRGVGFVAVDSKMFAVASGDGAAFHEPITAFYNALRLFAPAASLVLNHVTNADARNGGPARPFGGAFAFNGPRLIWEAKRDKDVTDATAIAFTCTKANNLPRKPEPFGLVFRPSDEATSVEAFNLADAAPTAISSTSLAYRIRLALASASMTVAELSEHLAVKKDTVDRTVRRLSTAGAIVTDGDIGEGKARASRWRLAG